MSGNRLSIVGSVLAFFLLSGAASASGEACVDGKAGSYDCSRVDLAAFVPSSEIGGGSLNDIWGWTDLDSGREFAAVGRYAGTSFVEITDPENPVYLGQLPTRDETQAQLWPRGYEQLCHDDCEGASAWRDLKIYNNHAFIVSEETDHGMQIFDMTRLLDVAPEDAPITFDEDAHYAGFGNAHNVELNMETGVAYAIGTSNNQAEHDYNGGPHFVDVSTPTSPQHLGGYGDDGYTHDAQCVIYQGPDASFDSDEICFNSNGDTLTIVNVSDHSSPSLVSRSDYPRVGYTHQGWLSEDHRWFYLNDELADQNAGTRTRTLVFDVSDLESPQLVNEYFSPDLAIAHNNYVRGDYLYQSNYTSGLRILDISTPDQPVEYGYFDSQPDREDLEFAGTWSNFPWFESGTVIFTDMGDGLFIVRPQLPDEGTTAADLLVTGEVENALSPGADDHDFAGAVRVTVENTGAGDAGAVEFVASLPANGELSISGTEPGNCQNNGRVVRCDYGDLASGVSFVVDLEARSNEAADQGLIIWAMSDRVDPDTGQNRIALTLPESGLEPVPPTADFSVSCNRFTCSFDASASGEGSSSIISYNWDLGDDTSDTGEVIEHEYQQEGQYTVVLTVENQEGETDQHSRAFTVADAEGPTAAFSSDCSSLSCEFDAGETLSGDAPISHYQWDFGDGTQVDELADNPTVSHEYEEPGEYIVTLTAVDENDITSETSEVVSVSEPTSSSGGSSSGCSLASGDRLDPLLPLLALIALVAVGRSRRAAVPVKAGER